MNQEYLRQLEACLATYGYQPELTARLDGVPPGQPFDQRRVNEIVLWKVNRYADLPEPLIVEINNLAF